MDIPPEIENSEADQMVDDESTCGVEFEDFIEESYKTFYNFLIQDESLEGVDPKTKFEKFEKLVCDGVDVLKNYILGHYAVIHEDEVNAYCEAQGITDEPEEEDEDVVIPALPLQRTQSQYVPPPPPLVRNQYMNERPCPNCRTGLITNPTHHVCYDCYLETNGRMRTQRRYY